MNPRVKNVHPRQDLTLEIEFTNDDIKVFDVKPYLEIGIFKEPKDINKFLTVKTFLGSIQWSGCQDLFHFTLYLDSR